MSSASSVLSNIVRTNKYKINCDHNKVIFSIAMVVLIILTYFLKYFLPYYMRLGTAEI
jgi:hypothetical protein